MDMAGAMRGQPLTPTGRVSQWSAKHRWWVLAATLLVLMAAVFASSAFEVQLQDGEGNVGESKAGATVIDEKFPHGGEASEQLLFSHPGEVTSIGV